MTKSIFNLDTISERLDKQDQEYDEINEIWIKRIYIGTTMSLTPSGKYYTPFACSNAEICESCISRGAVPCTDDDPCDSKAENWHCEACLDAQWFEQAEDELNSIDAVMSTGEGSATDLFIEMVVDLT